MSCYNEAKKVNIKLSATQMACNWDIDDNIARAAAADGAQIIVLQELFEMPYFFV